MDERPAASHSLDESGQCRGEGGEGGGGIMVLFAPSVLNVYKVK